MVFFATIKGKNCSHIMNKVFYLIAAKMLEYQNYEIELQNRIREVLLVENEKSRRDVKNRLM